MTFNKENRGRPQNTNITIVVKGDGGVGKSSLTLAWIGRAFADEYDPTVEDNYTKTVTVDGIPYTVEIIDTAGQEEYRGIWSEQTIQQGDAFVIAYAIDSMESFRSVDDFMYMIRKVKHESANPPRENRRENNPFVHAIIATKSDLPPQSRQVTASTGLAYAREGGGLFNETSAKLRVNVDQSFESLIRAVARSRNPELHPLTRSNSALGTSTTVPSTPTSPTTPTAFSSRSAGRKDSASTSLGFAGGRRGKTFSDDSDEKEGRTKLGKNKSLQMDRRHSMSIGGLGRDPSRYENYGTKGDSHGSGCKCVIM